MKKKTVLFKLEKELEAARGRQLPGATKDSGAMRGLKKAIRIVSNSK